MSSSKQIVGNGGTAYQAESMVVNNTPTPRNKSIIADVVNILSSYPSPTAIAPNSATLPAEIEAKIQHNNVCKSRYIIETYKLNTIDLTNVYDALEQEKPGRKEKLLFVIRDCYEKQLSAVAKGGDVAIEAIQENSDVILDNILNDLRHKVLESSNLNAENEDVDIAIRLILADAFIECRVLENPQASR